MRTPSIDRGPERILFSRLKSVAQTRPYRSSRFKTWLRERSPGKDLHHVFGSVHGMKSSDLLSVMVEHGEHMSGEENIDWLVEQMPGAIENLLRYVEYLEEKR